LKARNNIYRGQIIDKVERNNDQKVDEEGIKPSRPRWWRTEDDNIIAIFNPNWVGVIESSHEDKMPPFEVKEQPKKESK